MTTGALLVLGSVALVVRSPEHSGSYGFCPSLLVGIACPGCGGLRGTASLLHGDIATAWAYNPFVVLGAPLMLFLLVRWFVDAAQGREPWSPSAVTAGAVAGAVLVFGVVRNVPMLAPYLGPLAVP